MVDSDKVDLKSVNKTKTKKTFKLPKLPNPFKKQKGPLRDQEGKFAVTSGSSGLVHLKKINWQRALPLMAIVALAGGYLVYQSFATSYGTSVTAWYRACGYGNPPSSGTSWQGWVDKIKANPANQRSVYAQFKAAAESSGKKCPVSDPAPAAVTQTTPQTPVTSTANYLNDAKAWTTLGAAHVTNAKKENDITYAISLRSSISRSDLTEIGNREKEVRGKLSQMQTGKSLVQGLYNKAISNTATKSQGNAILAEVDKIQAHISTINGYVANIVADYKRAEVTFERLAQADSSTGGETVRGDKSGAVQAVNSLESLRRAVQAANDTVAKARAQAALDAALQAIEAKKKACEDYSRTIQLPIDGKMVTRVFRGKFNTKTGACSEYLASESWKCLSGYTLNYKKDGCSKLPQGVTNPDLAAKMALCLARPDQIVPVKVSVGGFFKVPTPAHRHYDYYWNNKSSSCQKRKAELHIGSSQHKL